VVREAQQDQQGGALHVRGLIPHAVRPVHAHQNTDPDGVSTKRTGAGVVHGVGSLTQVTGSLTWIVALNAGSMWGRPE
jgi:hypothetical protein